ncbi:hypothetical protein [Nocardiopsis ganjiahuensis]|uniref:hypothetical protein n=1 Tax=Nocardiopsis ganjiahuensis TaxID=239984 RepID=UPI000380BB01|nr:hypothetical protein [Nocardiopsis ganjiahuensis]
MNWAPRFPRVLSAPAVSLLLVPALLGAAAPAATDDPPPEGPSHAYVKPAGIECDRGAGTLTVVGQLFPVLSESDGGQSELSLALAAELASEEEEGTGAEETADLELVLVPQAQTLPGITAEEMDEAAQRAGTLTATLSGADGRLLTGDDPPVLSWADWEPPLGFYEVRVATESFSLPGFGECAVVAETPLSSVQVGTDDELGEQLANGADEAAADSGSSGWRDLLPWFVLGAGVLGAVFLLVPVVLHLRRRGPRGRAS